MKKTTKPKYVAITGQQALDLYSICLEAAQMHSDFLMHDDWDFQADKEFKARVKNTQKRYQRLTEVLKTKLREL